MDKSVMNDIFIKNFHPDSDAIHIEDKNDEWGITISRDENGEVSITVVDKLEHTRVDLILGQDSSTQRC